MAPTLKRRKIVDTSNSQFAFRKTINAFGKVSKCTSIHIASTKDVDSESDTERKHKPAYNSVNSKKRRREEEETPDASLREQPGNIIRLAANQDGKKAPVKKVRFAIVRETKGPATKSSRESIVSCISTNSAKVEDIFDEEIQNLIDMQNAMLNALALHYAHHGTASPVDVKGVIPQIEQKWGKRRVTMEDIQTVLGIQHTESKSALSLAQRSKSRVCIEYDSTAVYPLPVETLKSQFRTAITRLQGRSLPKEEIKIYTTGEDIFLSKGAQRLQDIKSAALKTQQQSPQHIQTTIQEDTTPASRATSLLSRILQKETLAANSPSAPTPEMLARKASLQRLEEIIPILSILSGSSATVSGRNLYTSTTSLASLSSLGSSLGLGPAPPAKVVSFTMSNVVQHLQNSMRHPIAKEEATRAVRLLADEVAPKWIGVRDVGSVTGVTFRGKIGKAEWSRRLQDLLSDGC